MARVDLSKCHGCPCFAVDGCAECPYLIWKTWFGRWPPECTPADCMKAKEAAAHVSGAHYE